MGIIIADPNDFLIENNSSNDERFRNFTPEYQNMIPYVEFFAIRKEIVASYLDTNGEISIEESNRINLLGYDEYDGKQLFTAKYLDNDPSSSQAITESFGIKSIDIKTNASYVPVVEITFVDIRGQSYFAKFKGGNSKYGVLLDFPPPLFVLRVKGVYGLLVEYRLHLTKTNIKLNASTGNYEITCNFIGYNIAPLTDINIGLLNAVHFIKEDTKNSDFQQNFKQPPRSFFEFVYISTILNDKLEDFKKTEQFKNHKIQATEVQNLKDLNDNFNKYFTEESIKSGIGEITNKDTISSLNDEKTKIITVKVLNPKDANKQLATEVVKYLDDIKNKNNEFKVVDIKSLVQFNNDVDKEIIENIYTIDYSKFYAAQDKKLNELQSKRNSTETKLDNELENVLGIGDGGWLPTIKNITELLTNDTDSFIKLMVDAANKPKQNLDDSIKKVSYKFVDNNKISNIQFPLYEEEKITDNVKQKVKLYPGAQTKYQNWGEVQLVENILNGMREANQRLKRLEELIGSTDGSSKWIPIVPSESNNEGYENEYFSNKRDISNLFKTTHKRFAIAKNYSYRGYMDKKDIYEFVARSEARNLVFAINDIPTLLQELKTFADNYNNDLNNFLNKIDDRIYKFANVKIDSLDIQNNKTPFEPKFVYEDNVVKRNSKFKGLSIIDDNSDLITDNTQTVDSTNEANNLLNILDDKLLKFYEDKEKLKLSSQNIMVFIDTNKNGSKTIAAEYEDYNSDFFVANNLYDYIKDLLEDKIKNVDFKDPQNKIVSLDDFFVYQDEKNFGFDDIGDDDIYKLYYSGLIEMPRIYLLYLGWQVTNNKYGLFESLSSIDKETLKNHYITFKGKINNILFDNNFFDEFIGYYRKGKNDEKETLIKSKINDSDLQLMKKVYLMNDSPLTFTILNSNNKIAIPQTPVFKFGDIEITVENKFKTVDKNNQNELNYFKTFFDELKIEIPKVIKQKETEQAVDIFDDVDLKTDLYYNLKNFFDRWLTIPNSEKISESENLYRQIFGNNLRDSFKYVDRAMNTTAEKTVMEFSNLINDSKDFSLSLYTVLTKFYSNNNFLFFPLQTSLIFDDKKPDLEKWQDCFKLNYKNINANKSKPAFVCMLNNSFSSNLNINSEYFPNDGLTFLSTNNNMGNNIPDDFNATDTNAYVFIVSFGKQNQSIFGNIDINTAEFTDTYESLKIADKLSKLHYDTNPVSKGQNLFNVLSQRSFSATVEVPLGNICIQPTMYFELVGIPLFNGGYLITEVEHSVDGSSNRVKTKFKGTRVGKVGLGMVTDPLVNVKSVLGVTSDSNLVSFSGKLEPEKYGLYKSMATLKINENTIIPLQLSDAGKNFIKNTIKNNKDSTQYNSSKYGNFSMKKYLSYNYNSGYEKFANDLISWINEYSKTFNINANIMAAQMYQESLFMPGAFNQVDSHLNAMGINQATLIYINDTFIVNTKKSSKFTKEEKDKIFKNISFIQSGNNKGQISYVDRPILLQNIFDNPKIMIKAQAIQLSSFKTDYNTNGIATMCLYFYAQGADKTTSYPSSIIYKINKGYDKVNRPENPPTQGTHYNKSIFDSLKKNFGFTNLDNEIDYSFNSYSG